MKVGYLNYAFHETHELTLAGATVETGALANLRVPQMDQMVRLVAADTGGAPRSIVLTDTPDSSAGRSVQAIALLDVKVETNRIDEVIFYAEVTGTSGVVTGPVVVPVMPDGFPRHLLLVLPEPVTDCSEVKLTIEGLPFPIPPFDDVSMAVTAGALWVGPVMQLTSTGKALAEGSATSFEDAGVVQRPPGGQVYAEDANFLATHAGRTVHVTAVEAYGDGTGGMDIQQLQASVRTTRPILWMPDTSTPHMLHRRTIYGYFTNVGRITNVGNQYAWDGWAVRQAR